MHAVRYIVKVIFSYAVRYRKRIVPVQKKSEENLVVSSMGCRPVLSMRAADVAGRFGCNRRTIYRLKSHFRPTGRAKDIPPSGRPPNTTPLEDIYLVTSSRRTVS